MKTGTPQKEIPKWPETSKKATTFLSLRQMQMEATGDTPEKKLTGQSAGDYVQQRGTPILLAGT